MDVIKCNNCGKCFTPIENQEKCPFCQQLLRSVKDLDLPKEFAEIFGDAFGGK